VSVLPDKRSTSTIAAEEVGKVVLEDLDAAAATTKKLSI
jgi:hypothetical protein